MGRPKEFDTDVVLNSAMHQFWADGVHRSSITALVEAMDIQRSSFYNSFGSRDEILQSVLTRYLRYSPLSDLCLSKHSGEMEAPDLKLIDLVLEFSQFLAVEGKGRGCLFHNGLSELKPKDGQPYEIFQDHYMILTANLGRIMERLAAVVTDRQGLADDSVQKIVLILVGLSHYSKLNQSAAQLARFGLEQLEMVSPHFSRLGESRQKELNADKDRALAS